MKRTLLKKTNKHLLAYSIAAALSMGSTAYATDYLVTNPVDDGMPLEDNGLGDTPNTLSWAILQANSNPGDDIITLTTDVTITGVMKTLLNSGITLQSEDGATHTISGGGQFRPLFVKSGEVIIKNLTLDNGLAKGGNGGYRGGGGAGLGGALFVYGGTVLVEDVTFSNNKAIGGSASGVGGGGGGLFGNTSRFGSGGGGMFGNANGSTGGYGGNDKYGGYGGYGSYGEDGGGGGFGGGGGGGDGYGNDGGLGGFGGGGGGTSYGGGGGGGGFGGGGGASSGITYLNYEGYGGFGGSGGFGGGGGGGGFGGLNDGGGFGGFGGFGGGDGGDSSDSSDGGGGGGGGGGMGGALFAMKGFTTLKNVTFSNNTVAAGEENSNGGVDGSAFSSDVFICVNKTEHPTTSSCGAVVYDCGATNPAAGTVGTEGSLGGLSQCTVIDNAAPTAAAGADQSIRAGDIVTLDGSESFDDNTTQADLIYNWSFTSTPSGSTPPSIGSGATPSFTAIEAGVYKLALVVTDAEGLESESDEVIISTENILPTADAGEDTLVLVGTSVTLDGSNSTDEDPLSLTYVWSIITTPGGSTAEIANANLASTTLTPDIEGEYTVQLSVSDELGEGTPATVTITATAETNPPLEQLMAAAEIIEGLTREQFTNRGNKRAFKKGLARAVRLINKGQTTKAINQLKQLIERTNGCATNNVPDGNGPDRDWVTDCDAQTQLLGYLQTALTTLEAESQATEAEKQIMEAAYIAAGLKSGQFTKNRYKKAFIKDLHQAARWVRKGKTSKAITQLEQLIEQSKGCAGKRDRYGKRAQRGWIITDCEAQGSILTNLQDALTELKP